MRDLSLQVPRGAVYGLLGPNGAGKTTTIRMILNIIAPDRGTIALFGQSHLADGDHRPHRLPARGARPVQEDAGAPRAPVPRGAQGRAAARWPSGASTSGWSGSSSGRPRRTGALAKIDELSRGMQQKVQFIGTLLHDPELVILDEPFCGLDPINAQALKDTVVELKAARQDDHLQHAPDGQRRADVRLGVHHRAGREGAGRRGERDVKAAHGGTVRRAGGRAATRATPSAHILADRALVARWTTQNRYLRDRAGRGADPQELLRRVAGDRRADPALRARAAVAAPDLPREGRRHRRRGGDDWTRLTDARDDGLPAVRLQGRCKASDWSLNTSLKPEARTLKPICNARRTRPRGRRRSLPLGDLRSATARASTPAGRRGGWRSMAMTVHIR